MTPRRRMLAATGVVALVVFAGCNGSSSSSDSARDSASTSTRESSGSSSTTTTEPKLASEWVGAWRASLGGDYGPAQQAFLAAIQAARVVEVQAATQRLLTGNAALRKAINAAGPPPAADRAAARRLKRALAKEHDLVEEMQGVCTGSNPRCEDVVGSYVDNNSKQVIPALVALRA